MSDTLQLDKTTALQEYKTADANGKALLEKLFGAESFQTADVKDRIKSYEDACAELGIEPKTEPDFFSADEFAYHKLKVIAQALNEGWKPDWTDEDQYKYFPWFNLSSGSSAVYDYCDYWSSHSYVGSRLCFKNADLAQYAGKQFQKEYEDFMLIK